MSINNYDIPSMPPSAEAAALLRAATYDLDALRAQLYSTRIGDRRPVIGVSCNHNHTDQHTLTHTYVDSIVRAGGVPLLIPVLHDQSMLQELLLQCDALVMTGGGDLHPLWASTPDRGLSGAADTLKDYSDMTLILTALRLSIPILGICRGMQMLTVALGGTLYRDIEREYSADATGHHQPTSRYEVSHSVTIHPEGRLRSILGADTCRVNSFHHQAVHSVPSFGTITAVAPDGVIEGVDYYPEHNALGVQWHPETLACYGMEPHTRLFDFIVEEGRLYRESRALHAAAVVVDSHTDTPMVFGGAATSYDIDLPHPDARVDTLRMSDGGVDAVVMVAYVPQGELTDAGRQTAFEYADAILHDIDSVVGRSRHARVLGMTTCTDGTLEEQIRGLKGSTPPEPTHAVLKGIENGYAIGRDLDRLAYFHAQGVHYITLCHNGDNDLCDSAVRSSRSHGGLSPLGREAVQEMERLGITVDVSHASDETVRDVLDIARHPIIASHSSCRTVSDHPRNLPDELLQAIAAQGGVVQACMYSGFVHQPASEASLLHYTDHLMHLIALIGAEHTGIGTDLDGDGEVIGCRHIGQYRRITAELLRRGVAPEEVRPLLGANFLRVLSCNKN